LYDINDVPKMKYARGAEEGGRYESVGAEEEG
jgi:hypothetical protein